MKPTLLWIVLSYLGLSLIMTRGPVTGPLVPSQEGTKPESRQRKIVFDSERDGNVEIYSMDPDGLNQRRLTHNRGIDCTPAWSPDGRRIAFASDRDGNMEIYVMDPNGSNIQRLTHTAGKESVNPAWSADGKRIAFESNRDGNWEIYAMETDGSSVQRLTRTPGKGKSSENPDWSPNGNSIAFDSNRDGNREIYVTSPDGSNLQRLTHTLGKSLGSEHPAWSPDGKSIAFDSTWERTSRKWHQFVEVYVMDADGSNVRRLTHTVDKSKSSLTPVWSPDGKRMAFMSDRDGASKTWDERMEIYVMEADGSNVRRLTFNKAWDGHPAW